MTVKSARFMPLHGRLRLRFQSQADEAAYRFYYLRRDSRTALGGMLLTVAFVLGFLPVDFQFAVPGEIPPPLIGRLLFLVLTLGLCAILHWRPSVARYDACLLAWFLAFSLVIAIILSHRPPGFPQALNGGPLTILVFFCLFITRPGLQCLGALLHFLVYGGFFLLVFRQASPGLSVNFFGLYAAAFCLGAYLAVNQHSARRVYYRKLMQDRLLMTELENLALHDSLTGIFNRRAFLTAAETAFAKARRYARPMTLVLLDLDHFKQINDRFGHEAGDRVLQLFCRRVNDLRRETDLFGRLGGEEFALLLPETGAEQAAVLVERILALGREESLDFDGQPWSVNCSAGGAQLSDEDGDVPGLLRRADAALYRAKHGGRGRAIFAEAAAREAC